MENTQIKRPVGRPRKDAAMTLQTDSFSNVVSGLGTRRDPSSYSTSNVVRNFSEGELEALYLGDGFARRIYMHIAFDSTEYGYLFKTYSSFGKFLLY